MDSAVKPTYHVPATTWLDDVAPPAPKCSLNDNNGRLTLSGASKDARFYAIYADYGQGLILKRVTSSKRSAISGLSLTKTWTVKVSVIDYYGNESPLQTVKETR